MWASSVLTYFAAPRAFRRLVRPKLVSCHAFFFFFLVSIFYICIYMYWE